MTRKSEREILDDIGSYDITHLTISSEGLPSICRIANNLSHLTPISVDSTTPLLRYTGALSTIYIRWLYGKVYRWKNLKLNYCQNMLIPWIVCLCNCSLCAKLECIPCAQIKCKELCVLFMGSINMIFCCSRPNVCGHYRAAWCSLLRGP